MAHAQLAALQPLIREVHQANLALHHRGLAPETWGNASGIDRARGIVAIKPSGIPYDALLPEHIVLITLDGAPLENGPNLRPSSDTPTHLELYRAFPKIGGVAHAHSRYATAFAQALRPIPCLGTTHADHFRGDIPITRFLTLDQVRHDYEQNTGRLIVETLARRDPRAMPAVLVAGHGPFTWGADAMEAVRLAAILEYIAETAFRTLVLSPAIDPIPEELRTRHFMRKHGPDAYYGQR